MKLYVDLIILYYIGFLYYKEYEKNLNAGFCYLGRQEFTLFIEFIWSFNLISYALVKKLCK